MGQYIYGIIKNISTPDFSTIRGIDNQEIRLVPFQDIAALISDTPLINFDRLKKEELLQNVAIHQKVNEAVIKDQNVVPMAFGTIADGEEEVKRILAKVYLQFKTALRKISGKTEFAVQVFWDEKAILEELAETDPQIQKLKKTMESSSKLFSTAAKIKLGKLVFQAVESQKEEYLKTIQDFLKECSLESSPGKLVDQNMIMNTSFLIEKDQEKTLDERMNTLGKKYEGKLRFKYVGPMPAYSFSNINLNLGNFELVDKARKTLRLGQEANFPEIKKAYQQLVLQYHPDGVQGNTKDSEKIKKITEAREIIENYCRSCRNSFNEKDQNFRYSFKKEDVKNSIMIH